MFTGVVEEMGTIRSISKSSASAILEIEGSVIFSDLKVGDSVCVNGVCLTVTSFKRGLANGHGAFKADVMHETLDRSSLGSLGVGGRVNLERAMAANGRFGGHIVSGHIDGTGVVSSIKKDSNATWYEISCSPNIMRYIVEKGSIAIDGISLTVARVAQSSFSVSIIPHTSAETTLSTKKIGDVVNLENDIIGKYVERLLIFGNSSESDILKGSEEIASSQNIQSGGITEDFLAQNGFI